VRDIKIQEIMTREVISAGINDTVEKCAGILMKNGFSGLPVLDKGGKVVGVLTEGDLIRRVARFESPGYMEVLGGLIYLDDPLEFMEELRRSMALRAGRLMSREVITVTEEDTVEDAASQMVKNNINRLPVVDEENRPVGIISRKDIMRTLFDRVLPGSQEPG